VPYANLTVKINRPHSKGPGENLVTDPLKPHSLLYVGNTINRQEFETQFILDLQYAIGIESKRVHVIQVTKGYVSYSWESSTVIVNFIILERNHSSGMTLLDTIAKLTNQIQVSSSKLYHGTNVTLDIDPMFGLDVISWDLSLKLNYAIQIIGGSAVQKDYYLNQGNLGVCDSLYEKNYSTYCEFERFFEDDLSKALNVTYYRIQVLFIKSAALDAVLIHFRVLPSKKGTHEPNVSFVIGNLIRQVSNPYSSLYKGNVTIRTDATWGVSGMFATNRLSAAKFTLDYYDYDSSRVLNTHRHQQITAYDRCKKNRRCNWGIQDLNQSTNHVRYYQQLFDFGTLFDVDLFLDFEDWRIGTRGLNWNGISTPTSTSIDDSYSTIKKQQTKTIRGSHFWPFELASLGIDIPCYLKERNQGLVLDRSLQRFQIDQQYNLVDDLKGRINWLQKNIETAVMGPKLRARKDVKANLLGIKKKFKDWWQNEVMELNTLNASQCVHKKCFLEFNTSSLILSGAIQGKGTIKTTKNNTEVAVFSFNSIYLGPEVEVRLVGQRALALVSKTSVIINTTLHAYPGTLGGFQGGGSVARYTADALSDTPRSIYICDIGDYCTAKRLENNPIISNNVNGPGSGNVRVYSLLIATSAHYIPEVQTLKTSAGNGQTLSGGFVLSFGAFETTVIPHDASFHLMKTIIEQNLNLQSGVDRFTSGTAGVGLVTVTRSGSDSQEGFVWSITFTSAIGNVRQLNVKSFLHAINATVQVQTIQNGTQIDGSFYLNFHGYSTVAIAAYESEQTFRTKLLQIPIITTAYVSRIDPTENCDDGLCPNGPLRCKGAEWTIYVTTIVDDVTPTSPSSVLASTTAQYYQFTANFEKLTGLNSSVSIHLGTSSSRENPLNLLNITIPFSLAYGGAGASFGGLGGAGYTENRVGNTYNDATMTDLLGGSGGCMGARNPFVANMALGPTTGSGGHGGGAIEIIAANELIIGKYGKIMVRGGDGEQTSEGGGGGGSGGSILLSCGNSLVISGELDASGGDGGYGGLSSSLAGGGGGGGRIAMYGDSITSDGQVLVEGGYCGVYKPPFSLENVTVFNASLYMMMVSPLDDERLSYLGVLFIKDTLNISIAYAMNIKKFSLNNTIHALLFVNFVVEDSFDSYNTAQLMNTMKLVLNKAQNTKLAEVLIVKSSLDSFYRSTYSFSRKTRTDCQNPGQSGTIYKEAKMTSSMYVKETNGGENTSKALFISNRENTNTSSGSYRESPFTANGPVALFKSSRPGRITYYTKTDSIDSQSIKNGYGSLFSLIDLTEKGSNYSNNIIGVYFGCSIMHGSNFYSSVDEKVFLKRMATIDNYPVLNRWYKIDIFIQWEKQTYSVSINDVLITKQHTFSGLSVNGIRLSVYRSVDVWFDEIYVGFDNTMEFTCPTTSRVGTATKAPVQRTWSFDEVHGKNSLGHTTYNDMSRHYNFLSTQGSIPFDGQGSIKDNQDIKLQYLDGDYPVTQGFVHAGSLLHLTNTLRSAKKSLKQSYTLVSQEGLWDGAEDGINGAGDGREFWYTEYDFKSTLTPTLNGGVAACSTQDMVTWRFEGIVLHYTNLSDMIFGTKGPFSLARPKVLYNHLTSNYVMWALFDNGNRTLAQSAIATSPYEDGPFLFRRSFYPDGNATRDQVTFINDENKPMLGRTYYQTIEFIQPTAVMQPIWESAKIRSGKINYRSNYQRAVYNVSYDNYNDIYNQRWRKENIPYEVYCQHKLTGVRRHVAYGTYNTDGFICNDPEEFKVTVGQGNPQIKSRFVSPNDSMNSWWRPTSVPAVLAQPWANNYRDGFCGIRKLNDDFDSQDPNLVNFIPIDKSTCSNIADNPIHPSLPDKLIGLLHIITTRRAKFIAISQLTPDYLDTTGNLHSVEGELESGNLMTMIVQMGQFGFGSGSTINSTFTPPMRSEFETADDYDTRFSQYIRNHNDRATYSLACVIDGVCPVNFRDQLTDGQK